jgi:ribosomal protein S12 methylthiotransferase
MLKSMRRGTTRERTIELVNTIRHKVPGIAIRTTLIAGYPGETNDDFEEMKAWVKDSKFERLGIFTYSHEENTHAFKLKDDVPQKVKQKRADDIMKLQKKISLAHNKSLIDKTLKVLVDRKEGAHYIGRTEYDSPEVDNEVILRSSVASAPRADINNFYLRTGDFAEVKITEAKEYDLIGEV